MGPASDSAGAERAWRRLVEQLDRLLPRLREPGAEEVVFEIEHDGAEWTLTRSAARPPAHAGTSLSAREREIARMVAMGYTSKTIAAVLEISNWTVETYVRRMFAKLGVNSRSAMVAKLTADGNLDTAGTPEWAAAWRRSVSHEPRTGTASRRGA